MAHSSSNHSINEWLNRASPVWKWLASSSNHSINEWLNLIESKSIFYMRFFRFES